MKRVIEASQSEQSANLHIQYIQSSFPGQIEVRSMTVKRPTFSEAIEVMLEHLYLPELDADDIELSDRTKDEIIESISYANGIGADSDYIFYFENRASGEVFIDNVGPEENY